MLVVVCPAFPSQVICAKAAPAYSMVASNTAKLRTVTFPRRTCDNLVRIPDVMIKLFSLGSLSELAYRRPIITPAPKILCHPEMNLRLIMTAGGRAIYEGYCNPRS